MWSGSIELGLINIPITVGKAWSDERETSLITVCDHGDGHAYKINRSERCDQCGGAPTNKQAAIIMGDGDGVEGYYVLDSNEYAEIENSTKTLTLEIKDAQPLSALPMIFTTGTYYIRHDDKAKVQPKALNRLVTALGKTGYGLVCQWGNSSSQKLCVIHAERGVLLLRVIPHLSEIRVPSKRERAHFSVPANEAEVEKMIELLNAIRKPKFDYASYVDHGLELRQAAVERILAGEQMQTPDEPQPAEEPSDMLAALEMALAGMKGE
jgi:non-homologous end joining protein Ku